ncbi:hypothetical protein ACFVT5_12100 [Streptomyces sp. NPDC058001]|uniref:hypothetical protein n=1 Tax=Streptomyces sp. NPDC058001 TaxID=3346300 RepID=UPI0036E95FB8
MPRSCSSPVPNCFRTGIRSLVAREKPFAVTEFGCTTHRGAADKGGRGDLIIQWGADGRAVRLDGEYIRDEDEQAAYLGELLDIFDAEGVDTAFVNTFARYDLLSRGRARSAELTEPMSPEP